MKQETLKLGDSDLFRKLSSVENLRVAWKGVRKNRGAGGVDGLTTYDFEEIAEKEIAKLSAELRSWTYSPSPVRQVDIDKPDGSGKRRLGIPTTRDRIVHNSVRLCLEPMYEEKFSKYSYGFRPNKGQQQAIQQAQFYVATGKEWCVDIDLAKFFDTINHDRLIHLLRQDVKDKRVIKLIAILLKSGILNGGNLEPTLEGAPQGSPLSPLLSNIVLDELDKELEQRGLLFCRFADDAKIYVGSHRAGARVMKSVTRFIETKLKLVVNQDKSQVGKVSRVHFLGFVVLPTQLKISGKGWQRARDRIRSLTPRRTHIPLEVQLERINQWYRGWVAYYKPALNWKKATSMEGHIRRRLRSQFVRNQKRRKHLARKLKQLGVKEKSANRAAFGNKGVWRTSLNNAAHKAWSNAWFRNQGFIELSNKFFQAPKQNAAKQVTT